MNCLYCNATMIPRNGKFGKFFSCENHGTLSIQGDKVIATGLQYTALSKRQISVGATVTPAIDYSGDLYNQVRKQTMRYGAYPTELEEWIVDGESSNSWKDVR